MCACIALTSGRKLLIFGWYRARNLAWTHTTTQDSNKKKPHLIVAPPKGFGFCQLEVSIIATGTAVITLPGVFCHRMFDYRPYVLYWCPALTTLDGISATAEERSGCCSTYGTILSYLCGCNGIFWGSSWNVNYNYYWYAS